MKCPTCGEHTPENWQFMSYGAFKRREQARKWGQPGTSPALEDDVESEGSDREGEPRVSVSVSWMRCGNKTCHELVIRIHEGTRKFVGPIPIQTEDIWVARPREGATRPIDPLVPENYRKDFSEAVDILNRSPRMSAVMSRRILADLLEDYAGKVDYGLDDRVRKVVNETKHPLEIRQNLQHFLQLGDFGAHRKKGRRHDEDVIIDVDAEDAAWLLDLLERLFGHFIVNQEKDAAMRRRVEEKLRASGQEPIKLPPDERT